MYAAEPWCVVQEKPMRFEGLQVRSISFGVLRDTWVPLVTLLVSLWTAGAGLKGISCEGPRCGAHCLA